MKRISFLAMFATLLVAGPVLATDNPPLSPELQKLDVSVGRWVFQGETQNTPVSKAGKWTWNENCRWSENHVFLECSFSNVWSGKAVQSLVVDTWNSQDRTYWHYEMFAAGASGKNPFVSRMTIQGNTWIEYGQDEDHGKKVSERIVYRYASPTRVSVEIQVSRDGVHWKTVDKGEGVKQV
ncbi:MAG: hypothetical protein WBR15_05050 [Gammaproteobacteria bacterium]